LSPLIHSVWAARAGVDGYYIPIPIAPTYEAFAAAADSLRVVGFAGVNVTLPHKENALRYAARASKTALAAGAANMLTFDAGGAYADNSDIAGFAAALEEAAPGARFEKALLLGAGGSARAVALALKELGAASIEIANRTPGKAEKLAAEFGLGVVDWEARNERLAGADIIVNATSLGMTGQPPLALETERIRASAVVADIVYAPLETPLMKAARARGCKIAGGLSMLMHQAAPGFRAWFGAEGVVDAALRDELIRELKRRAP
jgi:shikimate dehydrogenase